jgi:hypothetical protein
MGPKLKEPSPARRRRVEIMLQGWASFDHQSEIGFISADLPHQIGAFLLDGTRPLSRASSGEERRELLVARLSGAILWKSGCAVNENPRGWRIIC